MAAVIIGTRLRLAGRAFDVFLRLSPAAAIQGLPSVV